MQSLTWYCRRLGKMSPAEIAWRGRAGLRDAVDRIRIPLGIVPRLQGDPSAGEGLGGAFRAADLALGAWRREEADPGVREWAERLESRADAIRDRRLTFFHLENAFVGDPVDWHRDHGSGKQAPRGLSLGIDYRDYRETGDAKLVWEPNRHHHLVVLGRAYRALGDPRYADAALRQVASWIDANPYGYGMNWRSPLELAVRVINWVWALDLVRERAVRPEGFDARVRETMWRHLREIARKSSRGSSANNHLIGEAAGVFVGAAWLPELPGADGWKREAREILSREILRQTHPDGCTREQAFGYHLFVLQFFLIAGIVGRKIGMDFPPSYWERVGKMLEFAGALAEGGPPPMFGDSDDGYVLDLAGGGNDVRELLEIGARLFPRLGLPSGAGGAGEAAWWLLGPAVPRQGSPVSAAGDGRRLRSRAFPDSGQYLLQSGSAAGEDRVSVLFDCAELGYGAIAAHGHADALSFTLRVGGRDIFVDPGTFDYFTHPEWRTYFRSTAAHNTVELDGRDQSEMLGPFLWGKRAAAKCVRFDADGEGGTVAGEQDGYARLPSPARHIRTISMDAAAGIVDVVDEIDGAGRHDVRVFFHAAEGCAVERDGASTVRIGASSATVLLEADPALAVTTVSGSERPPLGWVSRGYHRKIASTTIVVGGRVSGGARLRFRLRIIRPGESVPPKGVRC